MQSTTRPDDRPAITRRTLARGAAWSAPIAVVSVAVPAFAASTQCVPGAVALTAGTSPMLLSFLPTAVTASVTFASVGYGADSTPGETGTVQTTSYSPSWNFIKLHHPKGMKTGNTITMTLTFSQPVQKLSVKITDIDKTVGQWIDDVIISPAGFVATPAKNVVGAGTAANPYTTKLDGGIENADGDLALFWAGPLSQVSITYLAADQDNTSDIGQHIGIGQLAITC